MIQRANEPSARPWRPGEAEGREHPATALAGKPGNAWPFISREAERHTPVPPLQRVPGAGFAS